MSEPIRNKKLELAGAPTPQNTPSANAPIASRAQEPTVASIKEEDVDRAVNNSILAQDPRIVAMLQGKLDSLVGRSSGYIESLPRPVRQRVAGLNGIQKEHLKLQAEHQKEVIELEKKYLTKFTPLYEKRAKIVNGDIEPDPEEIEAGKAEKDEENDNGENGEVEAPAKETVKEDGSDDMKGIPEFWLSALKNCVTLAELITDRDEQALKHLTDIRLEYLERPGFSLVFEFAENDFFTNKMLRKTYYYRTETGRNGDFIYDSAEADKIDWKPEKDLTVRIEQKKQRNKNTKQTRVVKKTVPTESFFNFFNPPKAPEGDDDAPSDIEESLELDYQLGEDIKEKIIPSAVEWFTGEALLYECETGEMPGFEDEDDEDGDDLSDDREDDDEESDDEDDQSKPKQEAAECKQS